MNRACKMKKKYPIARHTIGLFLNSFIRSVNGLENLPEQGQFIIASNSGSSLDSLIIAYLLAVHRNKTVHSVSKRTAFFNFFGDRICKNWAHCILMDDKDKSAIVDVAADLLKQGEILLIYPEGTRTRDGSLNKAKTGVARIALKSKAPVVPFGIKGSFEVLPRGSLIPKKLGRCIDVYIGKPMAFEEYSGKEWTKEMLDEITTKIMVAIGNLIGKEYHNF